jgi:U3 small nucleolar RNA-associated protein 10
MAVDLHHKKAVRNSIAPLSGIFLGAFDLRRILRSSMGSAAAYSDDAMGEMEAIINAVALGFISKLNDSTRQSIFAQLMKWTEDGPSGQDDASRRLRQQSVYGFLSVFFEDPDMVTSYASDMAGGAVALLETVNPKSLDERDLWLAVMRTLTTCFEHDRVAFWQAPTRFSLVAPVLAAQFLHMPTTTTASGPSTPATDLLSTTLTAAVVELALVANSTDHRKELNTRILHHLRSEQAGVRLAAVKCQQSLAERLGTDWLLEDGMLPEMLPYISELQSDEDEMVEMAVQRWIVVIETVLGSPLDAMLR